MIAVSPVWILSIELALQIDGIGEMALLALACSNRMGSEFSKGRDHSQCMDE